MSRPVIGFAGMTHLGLNSSAAAAERGFAVVGFDQSARVIESLQRGSLPVVEPGLDELFTKNRSRCTFTHVVDDLAECQVVYIAADVPTGEQGESDLSGIQDLIKAVTPVLSAQSALVILCQVPPGFTRNLQPSAAHLYYQVETLIFGRAVERALNPERFILGCADPRESVHGPLAEFLGAFDCPILTMRYESAELAKISINCCLVASVTVSNTLAELCERIGADWSEIAPALKLDKRIGQHAYLAPGLGLAGGNLERDLATVLRFSEATGSEAGLIKSFVANSSHRRDWTLRTLHQEVLAGNPKAVLGVFGLAYKENTHSTKNSPALALLKQLAPWQIRVHDPVVSVSVAHHAKAIGCGAPLVAARGVDALIVMTPWPLYRDLKVKELAEVMAGRVVIDPYRVFDGAEVAAAGLDYFTLGAPTLRAARERGSRA